MNWKEELGLGLPRVMLLSYPGIGVRVLLPQFPSSPFTPSHSDSRREPVPAIDVLRRHPAYWLESDPSVGRVADDTYCERAAPIRRGQCIR